MKRYFIVGTDTDCGKTYVTCQLVDYFKKKHNKVLGIKPVASGCIEENGHLVSQDVVQLQHHNGHSQQINRWLFAPPISPHLAAKEVGEHVSIEALQAFCNDQSFTTVDYLFIEGAGGLMAPINEKETWLDFLNASQIPTILVVGMRLGCLNHALLTDFALNVEQVGCVGWVANCLDEDMLALTGNIETLVERMTVPLLATIPYKGMLGNIFL